MSGYCLICPECGAERGRKDAPWIRPRTCSAECEDAARAREELRAWLASTEGLEELEAEAETKGRGDRHG